MAKQSFLKLLDNWYVDSTEGGKGDNKKPSDFDVKQVLMGMSVEMEHTDDPMKALEICLDHLAEDEIYYTKLKEIHVESVDYFGMPIC